MTAIRRFHSGIKLLEKWTGSAKDCTIGHRIFNGVSLVTLAGLFAFTLFNIFFGLLMPTLIMGFVTILQAYLYYLCRFRGRLHTSVIVYAITGQLCLITNFYYNAGVSGPTLFGFFLTLQLVVAVTPRKQPLLWLVIHIMIIGGLLLFQYLRPGIIVFSYHSRSEAYLDNFLTILVVLLLIFWITGYLKLSYERQRRRIEAQNRKLEQLVAARNKVFTIVAHDLQSPLATIQSYLELMLLYPEKGSTRLHQEQLLHLTKGTSDMLFNLLTWSRHQMEGGKLTKRPVNLYQLLANVLAVQEPLAENKHIKIRTAVNPEWMVVADREMIQLVIRNLINNAIKFSPSGSTVWLDASSYDGVLSFSVSDSGIGLTAIQESNLFSLKTTSTYGTNNEKGTGIGLTLCRDLMEKMGGRIRYTKKSTGGSVFTIEILLAKEEEELLPVK